MRWLAALVVAVGVAHAEPDTKTQPLTADEFERLATTTKPGKEIEVRHGFFMTFYRMQASAPLRGGWQRATSTGGAFSVEMPVKFNDMMIRVAATDGVEIRTDIVGGPGTGVKWAATCIRRKDGTLGPGGKEIEDTTQHDDHAWQRVLILDKRICTLTVERTGTEPLPSEADVKRFLSSIKSTGKPRW